MKAIIKKELYGYFKTPLAIVFAVIYLLSVAVFVFYLGGFFEKNSSELTVFFKINIWLYLFLIPAVSMRLWAEERKSGTDEVLLTLPLSVSKIVIGKFLGALIFVSMVLTLTFPLIITVNYLGNPDNGVIFTSYIANIFLAGAFLSIGMFFSSLTRNQIVSFICTILVCLFFVSIGNERIISLMNGFFSNDTVKIVSSLGFVTHFDAVIRGVINLKDIIFFVSFCAFWLYLSILAIDVYDRGNFLLKSFLAVVIFISLNISSYYSLSRLKIDFTSEKLYSLSKDTENILKEIDEDLIVKAYVSSNLTDKSTKISDLASRFLETLDTYRSLAKGKLKVEVYDPKPFSKDEEDAIAYNLYSIDVDKLGNTGYFGVVVVNSKGETGKIPFIDASEESEIEYKLSKIIYDLSGHERLKVGVLSGIEVDGVGISPLSALSSFKPRWAFMEKLYDNFEVKLVNPFRYGLPEDIDVLVMINPKSILDKVLYGVDQFLMRGGKILIFTDPYIESENLFEDTPVMNTNFDDVLKSWGIIYDANNVVLDPVLARNVNVKKEGEKTYLSWLALSNGKYINENSPVTKGLNVLNFASAGHLDFALYDGIESEILLKSSDKSGLVAKEIVIEKKNPAFLITDYKDGGKELNLAVKVKGEFKTAFAQEPSRVMGKEWGFDHILKSDAGAEVIIVSDIDFLYDGFWARRSYENTIKPVIHAFASNGDFVINSVDYLGGREFFNRLRGKKTKISRPLTKISEFINEINAGYRKYEKELEYSLLKSRAEMNKILKEADDKNLSENLSRLKYLQDDIFEIKRKITKTRYEMLNKVNLMLNKVIWLNILVVPLSLLLIYFLFQILNRKKS